jgi:hypothetical protein
VPFAAADNPTRVSLSPDDEELQGDQIMKKLRTAGASLGALAAVAASSTVVAPATQAHTGYHHVVGNTVAWTKYYSVKNGVFVKAGALGEGSRLLANTYPGSGDITVKDRRFASLAQVTDRCTNGPAVPTKMVQVHIPRGSAFSDGSYWIPQCKFTSNTRVTAGPSAVLGNGYYSSATVPAGKALYVKDAGEYGKYRKVRTTTATTTMYPLGIGIPTSVNRNVKFAIKGYVPAGTMGRYIARNADGQLYGYKMKTSPSSSTIYFVRADDVAKVSFAR